jgi:hypothetical protein
MCQKTFLCARVLSTDLQARGERSGHSDVSECPKAVKSHPRARYGRKRPKLCVWGTNTPQERRRRTRNADLVLFHPASEADLMRLRASESEIVRLRDSARVARWR